MGRKEPQPTVSAVSRKYYSLKEGAAYSGFSVYTLRELIYSGHLSAYRLSGKPGAELRIKLSDLDELLTPYIPPEVQTDMVNRQPGDHLRPVPPGQV